MLLTDRMRNDIVRCIEMAVRGQEMRECGREEDGKCGSNNSGRPYHVCGHEEHNVGRFSIVLDKIEIGGREYPYSYEKGGDFVVVFPMIEDRIILIHQYRHALNDWFWELPAGGLGDDTPEEAARRELEEETGYNVRELIHLNNYPFSLGTSTTYGYYYYAMCTKDGKQHLDATEFIDQVIEVTPRRFEEMISRNQYIQREGIFMWLAWKEMQRIKKQ